MNAPTRFFFFFLIFMMVGLNHVLLRTKKNKRIKKLVRNGMLKYKVIVLGSLTSADRIFEVSCDVVVYEHESIVFKKRLLTQRQDKAWYELVTMLAVPQVASVVELQTLDLHE